MNQEWHPTIAGETVTIRPIRQTDVELESSFIHRLSAVSKHFRFLGAVRELPLAELKSLCDVDGKDSVAFVATVERNGQEAEIGVSRYSQNSDSNTREIAVVVADDWQHRGLGTALVKHLIESAQFNGVKNLYSVDFADNIAMSALAKELGMTAMRDPSDSRQVIYSLEL